MSGPASPRQSAPQVQRLGPSTYRLGKLHIDTAKRQVVAPGTINEVAIVEFVANPVGGAKAYECALTLETGAVAFNTALLLIGLDPAHASAPTRQFDPAEPKGDPVDVRVTWGGRSRPLEDLLFDRRTNTTLRPGPWVYTGSTFVGSGANRRFLAELDGVLIGLMHGPQALIENPRNDALGGFGSIVLNPNLGLVTGTPITLTVKALPTPPTSK